MPRAVTGLILALAAAAAVAQLEPRPGSPTPEALPAPAEDIGKPIGGSAESGFTLLDVNRDRKISTDEARLSLELTARFAELDADGNGSLSRAEYDAFAADTR